MAANVSWIHLAALAVSRTAAAQEWERGIGGTNDEEFAQMSSHV